jgi:RIO kinase 1
MRVIPLKYQECLDHMKTPKRIEPLIQDGIVDRVDRQLMSGKEANVYIVICGEHIRCAKVYKEANKRSFRQAVHYTEGRKVKNSRMARAMEKGTRYGRKEQEAAWQNAEVDALYKLAAAGVRVPHPYGFYEGVLLMELVSDENGEPAPRLNDLILTDELARQYHQVLIKQVVRMLCAGIVHGDLSEYNVLVDSNGPVIIDLPQVIDAAANNQACKMLERDVDNLAIYFGQFAPELRATDYGKEIWSLYESGELHSEVKLTGKFKRSEKQADVGAVMREIDAARDADTARRLLRQAAKADGR